MAKLQDIDGPYIILSERVEEEADGTYSAFCDELGLATCAPSYEKASVRLRRAMGFTLNTLTKEGLILKYLEERKVHLYHPSLPMKSTSKTRAFRSSAIGADAGFSFRGTTHRPYDLGRELAGALGRR